MNQNDRHWLPDDGEAYSAFDRGLVMALCGCAVLGLVWIAVYAWQLFVMPIL